jgi:3-oxoacyl-[acyl-carrier protein] reductase
VTGPHADGELTGRVAVVSGGSRGVGAAIAAALGGLGADVFAGSRTGAGPDAPGVVPVVCDVRDVAQVHALVGMAVERFGRLDICVANAGIGAYADFVALDVATLDEIIDVNVKGTMYLAHAALPHLLTSDAADLLAVSSVVGRAGAGGEAVYAASKFAQVGLMRSLDHELWSRGVRCTTLCPGGIATDFAIGRGRTSDSPARANMLRPEEVADAAIYALTRPRSHRLLDVTIVPASEDSLG